MKYLNSLYFLMLCIAITLSSCNDSIEPNDNAIRFSYDTRSLESDYSTAHGTIATIWGYSTNGGWVYSSQNGLTATLNTTDNSFTVAGVNTENNPEYWSNDSYHFYSLWPPVEDAEVNYEGPNNRDNGLVFEVKTEDQKDQLMAYFTVSGNDAASRTTPVHFIYEHINAKLIFNLIKNPANAGDSIVLISFALNNVGFEGEFGYYSSTGLDWVIAPRDKGVIYLYQNSLNPDSTLKNVALNIESDPTKMTYVNENGYLIIPQDVVINGGSLISMSFVYGFIDKIDKKTVYKTDTIADYYLPTSIPKWEQNKKYTYKIYLAADNNKIMFDSPKVSDWGTKQGGATIIIQ